jgi:hypothetical protein
MTGEKRLRVEERDGVLCELHPSELALVTGGASWAADEFCGTPWHGPRPLPWQMGVFQLVQVVQPQFAAGH